MATKSDFERSVDLQRAFSSQRKNQSAFQKPTRLEALKKSSAPLPKSTFPSIDFDDCSEAKRIKKEVYRGQLILKENIVPIKKPAKKKLNQKIISNIAFQEVKIQPTTEQQKQEGSENREKHCFKLNSFNSLILNPRPISKVANKPKSCLFKIQSSRPQTTSVSLHSGLTINVRINGSPNN